jgi:hypothetical protein
VRTRTIMLFNVEGTELNVNGYKMVDLNVMMC